MFHHKLFLYKKLLHHKSLNKHLTELPDLVANASLIQQTLYIHDQPMYFLQCAMEENCAAPSAFKIKETKHG